MMIKLKSIIKEVFNRHWIKNQAQLIADRIGGIIVGSVAIKGKSNHDLDIRVEKYNKKHIEKVMKKFGFEPCGNMLVSPEEIKKSKQSWGSGWQRAANFINSNGQKIEVWYDEQINESKIIYESIDKEKQRDIMLFINSVWRYVPKSDRYNSYQFSLWMDSVEHLQKLHYQLAKKYFPNDDNASESFFYKLIEPTLESLQQKVYDKMIKKMNPNDPLFILKNVVKGKTYEGAKQTLMKSSLSAWFYKGGRIKNDSAEVLFDKLYRRSMGETLYDEKWINGLPKLSDLDLNLNKDSKSQEIFVQHYAGWKSQKFGSIVKVWRGTNSPLNKIEPGDFVTFDKDYAESYTRGKFGAILSSILPSHDLRVYKMNINDSEMIYWPDNHQIKKYTGKVPSFQEFWQQFH